MPEIVALNAALGARIEGLDRSRANDPAVAALLDKALADHLLVVIPGAPMSPEQTRDLARAFGEPRAQLRRSKRDNSVPEVSLMVSTIKTDGTTDKTVYRAEDWHTDDSYFEIPAKATLLHSIEIPSRGGSTWFCNMHSVYDALPDATKRRIDGKRAIHGYDTPRAKNRPAPRTPQELAETPDVEHPLVRTHPVTGRKAVYLNPNRLDRIVGLPRSESDALLDKLTEEARKPKHHHGHVWNVGDVVVWDNRATLHRVVNDYPAGEPRIMHRVLLQGERPA
ncbi:MAG: TauD/TfdA family dioxygenase [Betaproteobacteria bacterium]|nr:TauD/TfdA family dioxygenase [Betaproteobacteria bacterium]